MVTGPFSLTKPFLDIRSSKSETICPVMFEGSEPSGKSLFISASAKEVTGAKDSANLAISAAENKSFIRYSLIVNVIKHKRFRDISFKTSQLKSYANV